MSILNFRLLSVSVFCAITTACAHVSPTYTASDVNVAEIKQLASGTMNKISVGDFTADKDVPSSIICRGEGPVSAPDKKNFEQFIKDALVKELKIANLLNEASDRKLAATLNKIDFSSAMSGGTWDITMTFSAKAVDPFVIKITYPFESSFVATIACEQVAKALPFATQKLINELIKHPSFKKVVSSAM